MKFILGLFFLLFSTIAVAGVENTHHDMRLYGLSGAESVCSYCHIPHKAESEKGLFSRKGEHAFELGEVGAFCYTCHDGTVIPTAIVEAPDGTLGWEALARSHGYAVKAIENKTNGLESIAAVQASGLLEVDSDSGQYPSRLECTTCHDPHNNANPPFLKVPLGDLCTMCHSGSDGKGKGRYGSINDVGAANGPHPIGMQIKWEGIDRARLEQNEPEMSFREPDPRLVVPVLNSVELSDPKKHWSTGGHLVDFSDKGDSGKVGCSTCHSAHSVQENLLIIQPNSEANISEPLCSACHGKEGSSQNPGGTPFYHPALDESVLPYETSTIPKRNLDIDIPPEYPISNEGALFCSTCHRAHQGRGGAKALRDNTQGKKYICDVCHKPQEDVSAANAHHMTTWNDMSLMLNGRILSWYTQPGEPGDLSDGLTCIDCHTDLAKSAHNW